VAQGGETGGYEGDVDKAETKVKKS